MELTEFYRNGDKVIYFIKAYGENYYFYDGFNDHKEAIDTLTQIIKGKAFRQFLSNGFWYSIIK